MDWDPQSPTAYAQVCSTQVPIELEAASYNRCPFTRARVTAKSNRVHMLWQLAAAKEPMVVANVAANPASPKDLIELISYWSIHQGDDWHAVRYELELNWFTPHWMRAHIVQRERARRNKIRAEAKLPPLRTNLSPVPPTVVRKEREEELAILRLRHPKKNTERWGVVTTKGWACYAQHPNPQVRFRVVRHKECPVWILNYLLSDSNGLVRLHARVRLKCRYRTI